ncbi:MAG: hypothetical protein ACK45D_04315, partial [Alphaproteobacteria bacterium]
HPLFKINIAEQGTSHRVIATHHNLDPNTETVNHKYGNQATNFSSLLARIIYDPLRLVDCLPPFSAEANC